MPQPTSLSALPGLKYATAAQFASRPTLRQVAGQRVMQLLIEHYPLIRTAWPGLSSAEALYLLAPAPGRWIAHRLVEVVLQALLDGKALDFSRSAEGLEYYLSLNPPLRFDASGDLRDDQLQGVRPDQIIIDLEPLSGAFNDLVLLLRDDFCQAQVEYWKAPGSVGVSRDRWLQQALKTALLGNLAGQGLDEQLQSCVYGLLKGGAAQPETCLVRARLKANGRQYLVLLPNLLVQVEWDERRAVLWCSPDGEIKTFDSLGGFARTLADELAQRFHFEAMSWDCYTLEGDAFSLQAAMLLQMLLDRIGRLRLSRVADIAAMEALFAALSDPSQWLPAGEVTSAEAGVSLPPAVQQATGSDSFACQCALFDLAVAQAESQGGGSLDGVLDLHSYTRQQLRQRLLADHPLDANYLPDDLILTLTTARGIPGGAGAGVGGGAVDIRSMTLSEFAIGNLSALQGARLTGISHRNNQLIMQWMNPDYVKSLVQRVDIGGNYPHYVAQMLDDPARRSQRVMRFAREWRASLLFVALTAKLEGGLSETGLQCVVDYCRGHVDRQSPAIELAPLAFLREPGASRPDQAMGMYVLVSSEPSIVLLYRPLYARAPLIEFANIEAMMMAIREGGAVQDSILDWLPAQARAVYDHGGFTEPHLGRPILDTGLLPERVRPARFAAQFWQDGVDAKLYAANRDLLVELADRQSVSTAESRWAILSEGAWLLFNVVTLVLRGPVAAVAWLVQGLRALEQDLVALSEGSEFERSAAVVDLLLNAGMTLMHARLPQVSVPGPVRLPGATGFDGLSARVPGTSRVAPIVASSRETLHPSAELGKQARLALDFSWRGAQGFNLLSPEQRQTLRAMRADMPLQGLAPVASGTQMGLYRVGEHLYAQLLGEAYRLQVSAEGVRVVCAQGQIGPWLNLEQGAWRIDGALRLRGGMLANQSGAALAATRARMVTRAKVDKLLGERHKLVQARESHSREAKKLGLVILPLEQDLARLQERLGALDGPDADPATVELMKPLYAEKIAATQQKLRLARAAAVPHLEAASKVDVQLITNDERLLKPEYDGYLRTQEKNVEQALYDVKLRLVQNSATIFQVLWFFAGFDELRTMGARFLHRPVSEQLELYLEYKGKLNTLIETERRMLVANELIDRYVLELEATEKGFTQPDQTVGAYIDSRSFTTVGLRFHVAKDCLELALQLDRPKGVSLVNGVLKDLLSERLQSAISSHVEMFGSNLSVADRITILQEAWHEYGNAIANGKRIIATRGAMIDVVYLQGYVREIELLKESAGEDLIKAIREQELGEGHAPRPAYQVVEGKQHVVYTRDGLPVIGSETQLRGRTLLVVRDRYHQGTNLHVFERQGGQWLEQVDEAEPVAVEPASEEQLGAEATTAQALLAASAQVERQAQACVAANAEGYELEALMVGHIHSLEDSAKVLGGVEGDRDLVGRLSAEAQRLRVMQRELLIELYSNTPYPSADALKYLHKQQLLKIEYQSPRVLLANNEALDKYKITRLANPQAKKGKPLWEAHFHFRSQAAPGREFDWGHLKTWKQRSLARMDQLRAAELGEGLKIYRGNLRLSDVQGIIALD